MVCYSLSQWLCAWGKLYDVPQTICGMAVVHGGCYSAFEWEQ